MTDTTTRETPHHNLDAEQAGYQQTLSRRHVQMIAIGGAIGTGLFLGSASRLNSTGPALLLSYAFVGVIAYLLMRALGELVLHRPTSGAFVSYMREFFGERAAYITGWMYWLNWALTGIAELSAVGLYVQFWYPLMPTWATVLIALAVVLVINLLSARAFGEFEFWAAIAKVGAPGRLQQPLEQPGRILAGERRLQLVRPDPGHVRCRLRLRRHRDGRRRGR